MEKIMSLTKNDPWMRRFFAWSKERFPFDQSIFYFILYVIALFTIRFVSEPGPIKVMLEDFIGFFALCAFFFMLRIFDEHKDYKKNCEKFPNSVLQKGLITLNQLKFFAVIAFIIQLAVNIWLDNGFGMITMWWLAAFVWGVLIAVEFFCRAWLEKQIFLFSLTHLFILPLTIMWICSIGNKSTAMHYVSFLIAGYCFLTSLIFEMTRKILAPEEEKENILTYSKEFGTSLAPKVVIALLGISTVLVVVIMSVVVANSEMQAAWLMAPLVMFALSPKSFLAFAKTPSRLGTVNMVRASSLFIIMNYLLLICALVTQRGMQWVFSDWYW